MKGARGSRSRRPTSRSAPAELGKAYRGLFEAGASGVVSVHLSAQLSGTYESAVLAARDFGDLLAAIDRTTTLFYVDTLEFLRRGGRIGAASALLGTALAVKPILWVNEGVIVVRDKVRTASRALARLVDLAVEAAGESEVDIAVHHLAAAERAAGLADALANRLGERLRASYLTEVGAAVGAHVGPGLACVVVYRHI